MRFPHNLIRNRWLLLIAIVALLAAHLGAAFFLRHHGLTISMAAGVAVFVAVNHLGLLAPVIAFLRRRSGD